MFGDSNRISPRLRTTVREALTLAGLAGECCTKELLLLTLLTDRDARAALDALGVDIAALRARTIELLDDSAATRRALRAEGVHELEINLLLTRGLIHVIGADERRLHGAHMLVLLVEHEDEWPAEISEPLSDERARVAELLTEHERGAVKAVLEDAGVEALALKRYIAHVRSERATWTRLWRALARRWHRERDAGTPRVAAPAALGPRAETGSIPAEEVFLLMHNDPYTTKEFVTGVLRAEFGKSAAAAHELMTRIHAGGVAAIGVFTRGVAEVKTASVHALAEARGYPLRLSIRPRDRDRRPRWLHRARRGLRHRRRREIGSEPG